MSAMRRVLRSRMLLCALASVGACSSGNGATPAPTGRFSEVLISVYGVATARSDGTWESARVAAVVTDQSGRRCGWTLEGKPREIVGCGVQSGWEDGIPNPRPDDADTAGVATWERLQADTLKPGEPEPDPIYHHFDISNDAVTPVGLIDQGGCELRLDPIVAGKVQLWLSANIDGIPRCEDTTSVWVRPGVPSRWRLSWKATGDKCIVKIARLRGREPAKSRGR